MRRFAWRKVRLARLPYIGQVMCFTYAILMIWAYRPSEPVLLRAARVGLIALFVLLMPLFITARVGDIGWSRWWAIPFALPWAAGIWVVTSHQAMRVIGIVALGLVASQLPLIVLQSHCNRTKIEEQEIQER